MEMLAPAALLSLHGAEPATLDELATGGRAKVRQVVGPPAVRRRLMEMGLCRGASVELVRRAPLGDPLVLLVQGYLLSLRREQARLVQVVVDETA